MALFELVYFPLQLTNVIVPRLYLSATDNGGTAAPPKIIDALRRSDSNLSPSAEKWLRRRNTFVHSTIFGSARNDERSFSELKFGQTSRNFGFLAASWRRHDARLQFDHRTASKKSKTAPKRAQNPDFWPIVCNTRTALPSIQSSLASRASIQPTPWRKWEATLPQRPPQQNISFHIDNDANATHERSSGGRGEKSTLGSLSTRTANTYTHTYTRTHSRLCVRTRQRGVVCVHFFPIRVYFKSVYGWTGEREKKGARVREKTQQHWQRQRRRRRRRKQQQEQRLRRRRHYIDKGWKYRLVHSVGVCVCAHVHDKTEIIGGTQEEIIRSCGRTMKPKNGARSA